MLWASRMLPAAKWWFPPSQRSTLIVNAMLPQALAAPEMRCRPMSLLAFDGIGVCGSGEIGEGGAGALDERRECVAHLLA